MREQEKDIVLALSHYFKTNLRPLEDRIVFIEVDKELALPDNSTNQYLEQAAHLANKTIISRTSTSALLEDIEDNSPHPFTNKYI